MSTIKEQFKRIPILGDFVRHVYRRVIINRKKPKPFPGSERYWEQRYATGGNSGAGSYNKFAEFKAETINEFVLKHNLNSVIEFGCGDGNQLALAEYPEYLGLDVSETAISLCKKNYASDVTKTFKTIREYEGEKADLAMSLDVIYHLLEDEIFEDYIQSLFKAASRYVIIYSSNHENNEGYEGTHVRHRNFTAWIEDNVTGWSMKEHIPNRFPFTGDTETGSFSDFYIYKKD